MAQLLLLSSVALGSDKPVLCELASNSIVSRSSSGLAQVSNLGDIQITCRVPARPFPTEPGESRNGLRAATTAYKISPDGSKRLVPSEVHQTGGGGGGFGPDPEPEWVDFYVDIPLESAERDAEARRYLAKLEKSMPLEQITGDACQRALERAREVVNQHRAGHFQVECRILDDDRVMGVSVVELEVLFKGRFSDVGLLASPPASRFFLANQRVCLSRSFRSFHAKTTNDSTGKDPLLRLRPSSDTAQRNSAEQRKICRPCRG